MSDSGEEHIEEIAAEAIQAVVPNLQMILRNINSSMSASPLALSTKESSPDNYSHIFHSIQASSNMQNYLAGLQRSAEEPSAPSSSSDSPDLPEKDDIGVDSVGKRPRRKRKEFPIESSDPAPMKKKQKATLADLFAVAKKNKSSSENPSVDEANESINEFEKELDAKYLPALKGLEDLYKKIESSEFSVMKGTAIDVKKQIDKIRTEYDLWKSAIPAAHICIGRVRMSAEDQNVMNSVLFHYKSHHGDQFQETLAKISSLFAKQERIVLNNFKKSWSNRRSVSEAHSELGEMDPKNDDVEDAGTQTEAIETRSIGTNCTVEPNVGISKEVEPLTSEKKKNMASANFEFLNQLLQANMVQTNSTNEIARLFSLNMQSGN